MNNFLSNNLHLLFYIPKKKPKKALISKNSFWDYFIIFAPSIFDRMSEVRMGLDDLLLL